jgi:hypothetical protein
MVVLGKHRYESLGCAAILEETLTVEEYGLKAEAKQLPSLEFFMSPTHAASSTAIEALE